MHFVDAATEIVLVQVEINVRGLLAVHARRLIKSKRGVANLSSGTVRMTVATPDDQEKAHRAHAIASKCESHDRMAEENVRLHSEVGQLRRKLQDRSFAREHEGSGI